MAHLIPKQQIKKALAGMVLDDLDGYVILWDQRVTRAACYRHHTMLDQSRKLRVPRHAIPVETEEYAAELGLGWWLDREYGPRVVAA